MKNEYSNYEVSITNNIPLMLELIFEEAAIPDKILVLGCRLKDEEEKLKILSEGEPYKTELNSRPLCLETLSKLRRKSQIETMATWQEEISEAVLSFVLNVYSKLLKERGHFEMKFCDFGSKGKVVRKNNLVTITLDIEIWVENYEN